MQTPTFIVTLNEQGRTPRPSYGPFLWSNVYHRYVWRGEIAQTMGQLAELMTQAAAFLREQENYFLILSADQVNVPTAEHDPEEDPSEEVERLRGANVALRAELEKLRVTKDEGRNEVSSAAPPPAETAPLPDLPRKAPRKLRLKPKAPANSIPPSSPFETA